MRLIKRSIETDAFTVVMICGATEHNILILPLALHDMRQVVNP